MRRLTLAAGAACAMMLFDSAGAQNVTTGTSMPGQVVGSYTGTVNPVGQRAPAAAPPAGLPITSNAMMRPYDPNNPYAAFKGTNIDPKTLVAPLVGPDGQPVKPPGPFDKISDKLKQLLGIATPAPAPARPPFAPGVLRRNKERREDRMWRRD
jgi:hypothetical protein